MSPSLLIMAVQARGERIVCIQAYFPNGESDNRRYIVYFSPDYSGLQEGLDRETALEMARQRFEEDGNTVVVDHSRGNPVRIASRSPETLEKMARHLRPLNLEVEPLVWEELL